MPKHPISSVTYGRLPKTPSDEDIRRVTRDTLTAAEEALMDLAKQHSLTNCGPVGYTVAVVVGAELTCRDDCDWESPREESRRLFREFLNRTGEDLPGPG